MDSENFYRKQLGGKLNRDKVKLWEPPFTHDNGEPGDIPADIISKYATEMKLPVEEVGGLLAELRTHAMQKLAERDKFNKSGKATLKIKMAGTQAKQGQRQVVSLEIPLTSLGEDLKSQVAETFLEQPERLKLICSGRVIKDHSTLMAQNVKNGSQIMVLHLNLSETDIQQSNKVAKQLQDTRDAAQFLSNKAAQGEDIEGLDMQITDQTGKPMQLPMFEKKALTMAMTLHEKGRVALKKKNVALALPLLLEADKEFRECSSDLLNVVDNYAILCLDIVWCYLCLKNIEDLPDAADKLSSSEKFFHKSYGQNLERLRNVKGSTGEELALFLRLHLLQGIVAFHQSKLDEARTLLAKAEDELKRLQVDEEKLVTVMVMGFDEVESRLGLRACDGNVTNAVSHIMKRREEKKANAEKRRKELKKKHLQKHLGTTGNGEKVNIDVYEVLVNMGYPKGAAAESLRQSNNSINLALEVLQNHPEFLSLPDPEPKPQVAITDEMIAQVMSMGFMPEMASRALKLHQGDIQRAIEELVKMGGNVPPPPETPSTSSGSSAATTPTAEDVEKNKERIKNLMEDMPNDEEDYLDIKLEEEKQYLAQYLALVNSLNQ